MNDLDTSQSGIDKVGLASVVIVPQLSAGVKLDFPNDMLPLEETRNYTKFGSSSISTDEKIE